MWAVVVTFFITGILTGGITSATTAADNQRIVNGYKINIKDAPYQYLGGHFCGASIIGTRWALTAGHCLYNVRSKKPSSLSMRSGSSRTDYGGSVHPVQYSRIHPQFSIVTVDFDVAVVAVSRYFGGSDIVRSIPLPPINFDVRSGDTLYVTGWGKTSENASKISPNLRAVQLLSVARSTCKSNFHGTNTITPRMLCAWSKRRDTCQGDSGGPLVHRSGYQIGIVSWGQGCAQDRFPGVYTSIPNADIRNFIKWNTGI